MKNALVNIVTISKKACPIDFFVISEPRKMIQKILRIKPKMLVRANTDKRKVSISEYCLEKYLVNKVMLKNTITI